MLESLICLSIPEDQDSYAKNSGRWPAVAATVRCHFNHHHWHFNGSAGCAIANVALPTIASDLNATPASSIWVVNAYQIAIVISLLTFSFLGDMFGYRRIYKFGLVAFLLSSLLCALSDTLQLLTMARIAQGIGGAALMSVNTALIRLIYPQRFLGRGMGINSFIVRYLLQQAYDCRSHSLRSIMEVAIFN